ncbi:glycosyltransferase family 4 protein [Rhodosalinus sp.]|uniref:glycosyltransferase family 4 protein n=1 Tax=Rhodosalinus sp. TaxID=2047741 RepID=UPI00356761FC
MLQRSAFAVPGDLSAPTGGYRYDRSLLHALRAAGWDMQHVPLPGGFPFAGPAQMQTAIDALTAVPADRPLIVDGLAYGALPTAALDRVSAPVLALVHHPLAHETDMPAPDARRLRALERANLARAAHVIVPSPHIRDVLMSDYGVDAGRVTVLRPGRPEPPARPAPGRPEGPPLILSVGLLHPRKGHDVLISALARLAGRPWQAVIAGPPWEAGHDAALEEQIGTAGLRGRIRLAGRVGQQELARLYGRADVFALATRYEGYGIVFDEALVHGLPIVSTTAGAVPGTVPPEAGTLVPPDDPEAFAAALCPLLADTAVRADKAQAARRAGAALPSWTDAAGVAGALLERVARDRA